MYICTCIIIGVPIYNGFNCHYILAYVSIRIYPLHGDKPRLLLLICHWLVLIQTLYKQTIVTMVTSPPHAHSPCLSVRVLSGVECTMSRCCVTVPRLALNSPNEIRPSLLTSIVVIRCCNSSGSSSPQCIMSS